MLTKEQQIQVLTRAVNRDDLEFGMCNAVAVSIDIVTGKFPSAPLQNYIPSFNRKNYVNQFKYNLWIRWFFAIKDPWWDITSKKGIQRRKLFLNRLIIALKE